VKWTELSLILSLNVAGNDDGAFGWLAGSTSHKLHDRLPPVRSKLLYWNCSCRLLVFALHFLNQIVHNFSRPWGRQPSVVSSSLANSIQSKLVIVNNLLWWNISVPVLSQVDRPGSHGPGLTGLAKYLSAVFVDKHSQPREVWSSGSRKLWDWAWNWNARQNSRQRNMELVWVYEYMSTSWCSSSPGFVITL